MIYSVKSKHTHTLGTGVVFSALIPPYLLPIFFFLDHFEERL